jgi:hypothetical protein
VICANARGFTDQGLAFGRVREETAGPRGSGVHAK